MNIEVKANISHVKLRCISCGKGGFGTPEEHQGYMDALQEAKGITINHNFTIERLCDNCGCNAVNVSAKIDLAIK